jgi:hypothetical protein
MFKKITIILVLVLTFSVGIVTFANPNIPANHNCGTKNFPVTDKPLGNNFGPSCSSRDSCIAGASNKGGGLVGGGLRCDLKFAGNMNNYCKQNKPIIGEGRTRCTIAEVGYTGGAILGSTGRSIKNGAKAIGERYQYYKQKRQQQRNYHN